MKILNIAEELRNNSYPGRGIILGRSADNSKAVIAYFIMGRSVNSRNRIFSVTEDGIRTEAFDPSKMEDPSLIIYHPVRVFDGKTIVTNGDQPFFHESDGVSSLRRTSALPARNPAIPRCCSTRWTSRPRTRSAPCPTCRCPVRIRPARRRCRPATADPEW